MNSIRKYALPVLALAAIMVAITVSSPQSQADPSEKPVVIANTPLPVSGSVTTTDADNPARHPVQFQLSGNESTFTVPADQRLTIEFISVECKGVPPPTTPIFRSLLSTLAGGALVAYPLGANFEGADANGLGFYLGSSLVRIYADPGSEVSGSTQSNGPVCNYSVSGYMLPK
jgi:hypothetical protein